MTQRYSPADVAKALGITDGIKIMFLAAVMDESFQAGKIEGIEAAQKLVNQRFHEKREAAFVGEGKVMQKFGEVVTVQPPYPSCRTPLECAPRGYCRKDPACNS